MSKQYDTTREHSPAVDRLDDYMNQQLLAADAAGDPAAVRRLWEQRVQVVRELGQVSPGDLDGTAERLLHQLHDSSTSPTSGEVGSGGVIPRIGMIALATVDKPHFATGTELQVEVTVEAVAAPWV